MTQAARQAQDVVQQLRGRRQSVAVAESLTGGLVADSFVQVPGASAVFAGGVVAYLPRIKISVLDVPAALIDQHGVVSQAVAVAMAQGVRTLLGADWGLATTGVAGPGPSEGVEAGTVWAAVVGRQGISTQHWVFPGDREQVRRAATQGVIQALARCLASG